MRTNSNMNLNYNNKEIHNQPTIPYTPTTINLNNKNQPKIIMSNINKNQRTARLHRTVQNKHSITSPIINKIILLTTIIMQPTTKIQKIQIAQSFLSQNNYYPVIIINYIRMRKIRATKVKP